MNLYWDIVTDGGWNQGYRGEVPGIINTGINTGINTSWICIHKLLLSMDPVGSKLIIDVHYRDILICANLQDCL